jgi:transcriptional regulator with XRE-family HTH domain
VFGQRVKKLREQRGLTQRDLADRAGLTRETISNYERGERSDPPLSAITALAKALQVPVAELTAEPEPEAVVG